MALTDYTYLLTAFAGATVSYLTDLKGVTRSRVWPVIDALALGCWASTGAQKTLGVGLGWLPAVLLGAITAVGGGAVRDVVLRRVPGILGGNTLYATDALAGAGVVVLFRAGLPDGGGYRRIGRGRGPVPDCPMASMDPSQRGRMVG